MSIVEKAVLGLAALLVVDVAVSSSRVPVDPDGHCIWYGKCGVDPAYPPEDILHILTCPYTGPAKPAAQNDISKLLKACPHFVVRVGIG